MTGLLSRLMLMVVMALPLVIALPANAATVAYITQTTGNNAGNNATQGVLDEVFGAGGYTSITSYPNGGFDLAALQTYDFVYVEGGISVGNSFSNFLDANRTVLESYVELGGRLFLNGGRLGNGTPNTAALDLGFDTSLVAGDALVAIATPDGQAAVNGGAGDPGDIYLGLPISGDRIVGPGTALLTDLAGNTLLLERQYGDGMAWFGGLTTPNLGFGSAADILRQNLLDYMAHAGFPPGAVPEPATVLLLLFGAIALILWRRPALPI